MKFLEPQYLKQLIMEQFKDSVLQNSDYFINAVARTRAEEMIKVPIMNLIQASNYCSDRIALNDISLAALEHECIFTVDSTNNKLDLVLANDMVTDIIEFKISYAGEFYNNPIRTILPITRIPDGIGESITDLKKRHNDTSNVISILVVKDICAPNGLEAIPGYVAYVPKNNTQSQNVLIKSFHLSDTHLKEMKRLYEAELDRAAYDHEYLYDFTLMDPYTVDLGTYKDQVSVRLHFFVIYDNTKF